MGLIIPKNNADAATMDATLQVYYDASDWLTNDELIKRLSTLLIERGIEQIQKEPQSYTKKTQVPAYFGFIEWEDPTSNQSRRRLTESGRKFYEARRDNDRESIQRILMTALQTCTFGRNVVGCTSDSDIEAPNVFVKASLLLEDLSNAEFAFILGLMEYEGMEFGDAVFKLKIRKSKSLPVELDSNSQKWNDPKPITALKNWGFLNNDGSVNAEIINNFYKELSLLRTKNTEAVKFAPIMDSSDSDDNLDSLPLQEIFYGAPGTGKSHKVKEEIKEWKEKDRVVRTTFHPDSDYSTFVGTYKPTTQNMQRYDIYNKPMTRDGEPVMEQVVTYEFVPQTFLKAYVEAWKKRDEREYLVIEEINRGNCAQIFGDLFQLLDRGRDGFSEYEIKADRDLQTYLSKVFEKTEFDEKYQKVKSGEILLLPDNLYLRATMNTSDQSLFPIDSAFKRRWDWEYEPIKYSNTAWKIDINGELYSWASFQKNVNDKILEATSSEDKMLGDYFVNPHDGIITDKMLLNKILFYLWNH